MPNQTLGMGAAHRRMLLEGRTTLGAGSPTYRALRGGDLVSADTPRFHAARKASHGSANEHAYFRREKLVVNAPSPP